MLKISIFREGIPCERCCGKGESVDPDKMNGAVRHLIGVYGKERMLGHLGISKHTLKAYMTGARVWPDEVVKTVLGFLQNSGGVE